MVKTIMAKRAMKYLPYIRKKMFKMKPGASNQLSTYMDESGGPQQKETVVVGPVFLFSFGDAFIPVINFAQKQVKISV